MSIEGKTFSLHDGATLYGPYNKSYSSSFVKLVNGVQVLEDLFQSLYVYLLNSPKHHLEFNKLAKIVETRGLKILKNVKTWWI
jgi:hypothetical protein